MDSNLETIEINIDKEVLEQAEAILAKLGLTLEQAVNIFLRQLIVEQGIPFKITLRPPVHDDVEIRDAIEAFDCLRSLRGILANSEFAGMDKKQIREMRLREKYPEYFEDADNKQGWFHGK